MKIRILVFALALVLSGCVTTPGSVRVNSPSTEIPSIHEKYQDRFSITERGMSFVTFQQVWPEAIKSMETEEFAIYEFHDSTLYHTDADYSTAFWWTGKAKNHEYLQRALFYFNDGILVKYETDAKVVEVNG
jgi:hypothetical protein